MHEKCINETKKNYGESIENIKEYHARSATNANWNCLHPYIYDNIYNLTHEIQLILFLLWKYIAINGMNGGNGAEIMNGMYVQWNYGNKKIVIKEIFHNVAFASTNTIFCACYYQTFDQKRSSKRGKGVVFGSREAQTDQEIRSELRLKHIFILETDRIWLWSNGIWSEFFSDFLVGN